MTQATTTRTTDEAVRTYKTNKIEGATPGELVLHVYDYVIACCRRKDLFGAKRGIVELQGALDLDHLDVAGPLFRIYEYTCDILREEKYDEAERIVGELRTAWRRIVDLAEAGGPAMVGSGE